MKADRIFKNIALRRKKKRKEIPFGLDIGDSGIRIAQVSKNAEGITLQHLVFSDFSLQAEGIDSFTLLNSLRELLRKCNIESRLVVANLYGTEPILKFINLPYMSDEELRKTIKWEAAKFIVYDLDKMVIDYAVLEEIEEAGKKKLHVAVAASTKEVVLNEISLLREAGLEPVSIEVDTLAHLYMSKINGIFKDDEVVVFIDIGAKKINIQVIDSGVPVFRRECPSIGSMDINRALKEELQIELSEAEDIKRRFSLNNAEPEDADGKTVYRAIVKSFDATVMEIKRSLDYYIDSFPQKMISRIILTGGGACLKRIESFLSQRLGIAVEILNPFEDIRISDELKDESLKGVNPTRFSTVLGLALEALG